MENKRVFRTALGGFNKEDVNRFISELSRHLDECVNYAKDCEERINAAEQRIAELQIEYENKAREADEVYDKLESCSQSLISMRERSHQLVEEKIKLAREVDKYKTIATKPAEVDPEVLEKARRYEQNSMHIANAMISAREEADKIIDNAISIGADVRRKIQADTSKVYQEIERANFEYSEIQQGINRYTEQMRTILEAVFVELDGSQIRMKELDEFTHKLPLTKMEYYANKE